MGELIFAIVLGLISFAAYTRSKKFKSSNEKGKATFNMIASILIGAFAVIMFLAMFF